MQSKKALQGAVMLETQWATRGRDIIDLITPFVQYSVAKCTSPGDVINIEKIIACMCYEFGYVDIPEAIIKKVFQRNKNMFQRNHSQYILASSLDSIVSSLETRRQECESHIDVVGKSLYEFLKDRCQKEKIYSQNQAIERLHDFFGYYGLDIGVDRLRMDVISRKSSEVFYYIARFIIEKQAENAVEYKSILALVKGYYLEAALYVQYGNGNLMTANYNKVAFYYDTPFLIQLLGYQSEQEEKKAKCLHELLRGQKGKFFFFPQTFDEITNILTAYGYSLTSRTISNKTLAGLDEKKYTYSDVERLKNSFQSTLKSVYGIELVDLPSYPQRMDGTVDPSKVIGETALEDYIRSRIPGYKPDSLRADMDSAIAIHKLRTGNEGQNIENCRHLFVTTNIDFANAFNSFYHQEYYRDTFDLIIDAGRLAAISWVKVGMFDSKIPELQLLENAYAAQQPPPELMEKLTEILNKFEHEGVMTYEEAVSIRTSHFSRKELLIRSNGNSEMVNETFVEQIREDYKKYLIADTKRNAVAEVTREFADKNAAHERDQYHRAEQQAKEIASNARLQYIRKANCFVSSVAFIIIAISVWGCFKSNSFALSVPMVLFMIVSVMSVFDTIWSKKWLFSKYIEKKANEKEAEVFDKEYKRFVDIL